MNKVKFIYNPYSGENAIISKLDKVIKVHQKYELTIVPYRIDFKQDICNAFKDIDDTYKYILIAGGDGTVDRIVNYMKYNEIDLPIAILPVGTANDFAKFIGMPRSVEKACNQIINSVPKDMDIGKINDKYFINVASMGLFTDVSQKTDINMKNTMGKLAYYIKGFEEATNFRKLKVKVTSPDFHYDGEMYLLLVFNGQTAGNLKLAYKAKVDDGKLDVIIVKAVPIAQSIGLIIKVLNGKHLEKSNEIIYCKTNELTIECDEDIATDIDGEKGPDFPLSISCEKGGIKVLGIKNKKS